MKRNINEAIHQRRRTFAGMKGRCGRQLGNHPEERARDEMWKKQFVERDHSDKSRPAISSEKSSRSEGISRMSRTYIYIHFRNWRPHDILQTCVHLFQCSTARHCLRLDGCLFSERFVKSLSNYCPFQSLTEIQDSLKCTSMKCESRVDLDEGNVINPLFKLQ